MEARTEGRDRVVIDDTGNGPVICKSCVGCGGMLWKRGLAICRYSAECIRLGASLSVTAVLSAATHIQYIDLPIR